MAHCPLLLSILKSYNLGFPSSNLHFLLYNTDRPQSPSRVLRHNLYTSSANRAAFIHVAILEWASCDANLSTRLDIQTKDHLSNPDRKSVLPTQGTLSHYFLKSFPKLIRPGLIES